MGRSLMILLVSLSCLTSCFQRATYKDNCAPLIGVTLIDIVIDNKSVIRINNIDSLETVMFSLNSARFNGVWKGAKWDQIIVQLADSTKVFNTNGQVFSAAGEIEFYDLPRCLSKYWGQK